MVHLPVFDNEMVMLSLSTVERLEEGAFAEWLTTSPAVVLPLCLPACGLWWLTLLLSWDIPFLFWSSCNFQSFGKDTLLWIGELCCWCPGESFCWVYLDHISGPFSFHSLSTPQQGPDHILSASLFWFWLWETAEGTIGLCELISFFATQ